MNSIFAPPINIYPGKMAEASDINSAFDWTETVVHDMAYALQRPDGYGLIAVPDLLPDLRLAGNELRLKSIAAITPGGTLVLQHPVQSPPVFIELRSTELVHSEYIIYVLAKSERQPWNTPESKSNSIYARYRFPIYELHLKDGVIPPHQFPGALPIGRLMRNSGGSYCLDEQFQAPCAHLAASEYMWSFTLRTKELWGRMLAATNRIIIQTTGVPYNAPLGDLNRLASWVWQYLITQKPAVLYLREKSHPADLFLAWAGLATLFNEFLGKVTQRPGEMLNLLSYYAQGRPGYVFNANEASHSAIKLANTQYIHWDCVANFSVVSDFLHLLGLAWIFLGETDAIRWVIDQNAISIK